MPAGKPLGWGGGHIYKPFIFLFIMSIVVIPRADYSGTSAHLAEYLTDLLNNRRGNVSPIIFSSFRQLFNLAGSNLNLTYRQNLFSITSNIQPIPFLSERQGQASKLLSQVTGISEHPLDRASLLATEISRLDRLTYSLLTLRQIPENLKGEYTHLKDFYFRLMRFELERCEGER